MTSCGLFLKSNEVRVITLKGARADHEILSPKVTKFSLEKNPSKEHVAQFAKDLKNYCVNNDVEKIVINRRASSGKGAGGAGTFLMEGVILATSSVPVIFVHPATMRATDNRQSDLKTKKPTTIAMAKAYDLSFEGLN
jgi:hypothetical protein